MLDTIVISYSYFETTCCLFAQKSYKSKDINSIMFCMVDNKITKNNIDVDDFLHIVLEIQSYKFGTYYRNITKD